MSIYQNSLKNRLWLNVYYTLLWLQQTKKNINGLGKGKEKRIHFTKLFIVEGVPKNCDGYLKPNGIKLEYQVFDYETYKHEWWAFHHHRYSMLNGYFHQRWFEQVHPI